MEELSQYDIQIMQSNMIMLMGSLGGEMNWAHASATMLVQTSNPYPDVVPLAICSISLGKPEAPAQRELGLPNWMALYSSETIRGHQLKDPDLQPIITWLEKQIETS